MRFIYTNGKNADFANLCNLLDISLDKLAGGNENRKQYEQYNALDDIHDVFIAYDDNLAVGCASFKEIDNDTVEAKRVFVKESHRGLGISKALMQLVEDKAKEKSYKKVILETSRHLTSANGLYKNTGYKIIPNYGQYIGMEKSICFQKML